MTITGFLSVVRRRCLWQASELEEGRDRLGPVNTVDGMAGAVPLGAEASVGVMLDEVADLVGVAVVRRSAGSLTVLGVSAAS